MRRGFKTWSENQALKFRHELSLRPDEPLPAARLAEHLGIVVIAPHAVPGATHDVLAQLLKRDPSGWSAFTVAVDGLAIVVHNAAHASPRQESDLMHELAHIICRHPAMRIVTIAGLAIREYSEAQEEEAAWLGGCLHLPRAALWSSLREGLDTPVIMTRFNASKAMVRYRRNVTGIDVQLARLQSGF